MLISATCSRRRGDDRSSTVRLPGRWTYRVGVAANWLDDPSLGDVVLVSAGAVVTVPYALARRSRCSSSASRCARIVFWSASFEITVE